MQLINDQQIEMILYTFWLYWYPSFFCNLYLRTSTKIHIRSTSVFWIALRLVICAILLSQVPTACHSIWSQWAVTNASVTTRHTCYGPCGSGAAAEIRLKFCVSYGWLGSESDSAATVPATHVSWGRHASDTPNRTHKIPQRRHIHLTIAVLSRYLQRDTSHVSVRRCGCLYLSGLAPVCWRHHSRVSHARTYPPWPEYI